jgi:hypothetical protein
LWLRSTRPAVLVTFALLFFVFSTSVVVLFFRVGDV